MCAWLKLLLIGYIYIQYIYELNGAWITILLYELNGYKLIKWVKLNGILMSNEWILLNALIKWNQWKKLIIVTH